MQQQQKTHEKPNQNGKQCKFILHTKFKWEPKAKKKNKENWKQMKSNIKHI